MIIGCADAARTLAISHSSASASVRKTSKNMETLHAPRAIALRRVEATPDADHRASHEVTLPDGPAAAAAPWPRLRTCCSQELGLFLGHPKAHEW